MGLVTHYFFALKLPNDTKHSLKNYSGYLKGVFPFSRWVHEQDFHITLAFLGNAEEKMLEDAKRIVANNIAEQACFSLTIDHLGIFGKEDSPRIFWAGVGESQALSALRDHVFHGCLAAGFTLETRAFHPHITIARKWRGCELFSRELFEKEQRIPTPIRFVAKEVVLYKTHMDRTPKYEEIATYKLLLGEDA